MDENENKSNVEETTTSSANGKASDVLGKVKEFLSKYKKALIGLVVVILALVVLSNVFLGGKKRVVKKFINAMDSGNAKKAFKCIDMAGMQVLYTLDEDDYEDFYEEYKDYVDSDEWEDLKEEIDEELDDTIEDLEDTLDDSDGSVKVKKFKDVKKEGKNLWKVKVQLQTKDEDGDKDTQTTEFYVMKKGFKYYIVGGFGTSMF